MSFSLSPIKIEAYIQLFLKVPQHGGSQQLVEQGGSQALARGHDSLKAETSSASHRFGLKPELILKERPA